jgi:hypothetical protein
MATICELQAAFEEPQPFLYEMLISNLQSAERWGTRWDVVRDEAMTAAGGEHIRQVWGFTTAYARMDGMGGHVSFLMKFIAYEGTTEIQVVVTSPYEKKSSKSAYYRRNHQVALRLLEFCVAPYDEIHPRVGTIKRIADSVLSKPTHRTT